MLSMPNRKENPLYLQLKNAICRGLIAVVVASLLSVMSISPSFGNLVLADWDDTAGGSLNGNSFTFTPAASFLDPNVDLSGSSYSAAPGTSNEEAVLWSGPPFGFAYTASFANPVDNPLIYFSGLPSGPPFSMTFKSRTNNLVRF